MNGEADPEEEEPPPPARGGRTTLRAAPLESSRVSASGVAVDITGLDALGNGDGDTPRDVTGPPSGGDTPRQPPHGFTVLVSPRASAPPA
jgi:hypothetical protein